MRGLVVITLLVVVKLAAASGAALYGSGDPYPVAYDLSSNYLVAPGPFDLYYVNQDSTRVFGRKQFTWYFTGVVGFYGSPSEWDLGNSEGETIIAGIYGTHYEFQSTFNAKVADLRADIADVRADLANIQTTDTAIYGSLGGLQEFASIESGQIAGVSAELTATKETLNMVIAWVCVLVGLMLWRVLISAKNESNVW